MTQPRDLISFGGEALSAQVDLHGAQLFTLRDAAGHDLLWDGDPSVWTGRAPILFPIVGLLNQGSYHLDGCVLRLGKHGFARHRLFECVGYSSASALLRLTSDLDTLASYPFAFELDILFAITGPTLTLSADIRNRGATPMPASFGFHPALRWPLPYGQGRTDHALVFEHDEAAPIRRLDPRGLLKPEGFPTPVEGRRLLLHDALFTADAVMFDALASQSLRYGAEHGPSIEVAFPDTPYLGVWTKPGADFICIEPCYGINDPEGFSGEIWNKPGILIIEPSGSKTITMSITLRA